MASSYVLRVNNYNKLPGAGQVTVNIAQSDGQQVNATVAVGASRTFQGPAAAGAATPYRLLNDAGDQIDQGAIGANAGRDVTIDTQGRLTGNDVKQSDIIAGKWTSNIWFWIILILIILLAIWAYKRYSCKPVEEREEVIE